MYSWQQVCWDTVFFLCREGAGRCLQTALHTNPQSRERIKRSYKTNVSFDCFKQPFKYSVMIMRERKAATGDAAEENTRDKILSAAGEVFAKQGFEGATIRAITERAGVNVAAVNYHFRDKAELYARVVLDACSLGAVWRDLMANSPDDPEERLRGLIHQFLHRLLDPSRPVWKVRLIVRELADPTKALDELVEKNIRPFRDEFLLPTLRELAGDCCTRRQLGHISASIMGQCLYYAMCRPILERLKPEFTTGELEINEIAEHISQFSLAAIAELTRLARRS
jgi:TetR/AcrR family transcriptional regulator, regulator of cefoperazone and chloramphenicol sensitivity